MIDPIALSIFGLDIRWYGITYAVGFALGYFYVMHFAKDFGLKKQMLEDVFLYSMIFSILGGRVFYILFYNLGYYISDPLKIFAVWEGGMSIHGSIFFGVLTVLYFAKKNKINPLKISDLFIIPISFGLALGRLANYVNQELVGKTTQSSLGVTFPLYDDNTRWPYQLFASFKNLLVFNALLYMQFFKKLKTGTITATFLILYSFGRFIVDFLRVPTIDLGLFSMGQLLSLIYGLAGLYLLYRINKN